MVESAYKCGYNVYSISYFNDIDLYKYSNVNISYLKNIIETKSLREKNSTVKSFFRDAIEKILSNYRVDFVVPKINEEYIEKICNMYGVKVVGNDFKKLNLLKDKVYVYKICEELNIPIPDYIVAKGEDKAYEFVREHGDVIIKPRDGSGGYDVFRIKDIKKLDKSKLTNDYLLQEYINGESLSINIYSNGRDLKLLFVSKQLVGLKEFGAEEFKYCGNIGFYYTKRIKEAFNAFKKLIEYFELKGIMGGDFILSKGKIYLVDFNPRIQSSFECMEHCYRKPFFKYYLNAFDGRDIDKMYLRRSCAKIILYAKDDCKILKDYSGYAKDVPFKNTLVLKGEPMLTLIKSGRNSFTCYNKIKKLSRKIYLSI